MLFKRDIQKRAWNGKGSLTLKTLKSGEAYWIFRKRAIVDSKKKYTYVRLGSLKQLPTKEDAWAAAEYLCGSGFHTVADMIRSRHLPKGRSNLPNFSVEWFTAKMNEQEGKCAICRRQPKCLVVDHDHA